MAESVIDHRYRDLENVRQYLRRNLEVAQRDVLQFFDSFNTSLEQETPGQALAILIHSLKTSTSPLDRYLDIDSACREVDVSFLDCLSEIGADCIKGSEGKLFQHAMRDAADLTGVTSIRFLSAWAALNLDDYQSCIDECDRVDEPFACIYTLQGQAYLESGSSQEAANCFRLATQLGPNEVLAWFLLAKTEHLNGDNFAAWSAIQKCQRLAPMSPEVDLMAGLIAIRIPDDDIHTAAWNNLVRHLQICKDNVEAILVLQTLCFLRNDRSGIATITSCADWSVLMMSKAYTNRLSKILKEFNDRQWHHEAAHFLEQITPRRTAL